jgi:hypothetical protein
MIDVDYPGRFGNHLFCYAFARLMAEDHNEPYCMSLPDTGVLHSNDAKMSQRPPFAPVMIQEDFKNREWAIPALIPGDFVKYTGYFQRWEYYEGNRDRVRGFFHLPETYPTDPKEVCLHVRLTDYHEVGLLRDPTVYASIIDKIYDGKLYIVTDDYKDPYLDYFKKRYANVSIVSNTAAEDFSTLMSFEKIVASNSTFSWWAAYLGVSKNPYIPMEFGAGVGVAVDIYKLGTGF